MRQKRFINQLKVPVLCMVLVVLGFQTALADPPAATSDGYRLFRDVEASAGKITSASYAMTGIACEPSPSDSVTSASFTLRLGYKISESRPHMTINDVTVAEGDSGTTTAQFTVSLGYASSSTITVNYATANSSATAGSDYTGTSGTLTLPAGSTGSTVNVLVSGDNIDENNETFHVNLTGASYANITDSQGAGTITDDDSTPVANNDNCSVNEDTTLTYNVLSNDDDADGDTLTASQVSGAANGTLKLNSDGSFTYTPNADWSGIDFFTYKASDGANDSTAEVRITVASIGDTPKFVEQGPITVEMDEDGHPEPFSLILHVTDSDKEDKDILNWSISMEPEHGMAETEGVLGSDISSKNISYLPYAHYYGDDSFEVQISDKDSVIDSITVNVIIRPLNDAPIISEGESVTFSAGNGCDDSETFTFTLHAVNVDKIDIHVWSMSSDPEHGAAEVDTETGEVAYTPDFGYFGTDMFEISVSDGVYTDTIPVTMIVTLDPLLTDPGDVDGDDEVTVGDAVLTLQILTKSDSGYINLCADINRDSRIGQPELIYILRTVVEIPPAPVIARDDSIMVNKNSLVRFFAEKLLENDTYTDTDTPTITGYTSPSHGSVYNDTDFVNFRYKPVRNYTGPDSFTYDVLDGTGNMATATVNVLVNNQPNVMDDYFTTEQDTTLIITAESLLSNDTDADGDYLVIDNYNERPSFQGTLVDNDDGTYTYTPKEDFIGKDSFRYSIFDGKCGYGSAKVTITVE